MKKFLFITTLTPRGILTPIRSSLFELYLKALKNQSYNGWEAILIGEHEKKDGNITYLKTDAVSKPDKLKFAHDYLLKLETKPDYLIRLDDDDIISPDILQSISKLEYDCYSDLYHTFYDLTSGKTAQLKRPWLPNTVIHKFEYAMTVFGETKLPLFMQDHSKEWHIFYKNKKVLFAPKKSPVYLRIISPTTITSMLYRTKTEKPVGFDMEEYGRHLLIFGKWKNFDCPVFNMYFSDLIDIWEDYTKEKLVLKKGIFNFFK